MSNHELLVKMIDKFGIEKTISFAEQVSYMYKTLYKQAMEENPHEFTEYGYESNWWATKFEELKSKKSCYSYYEIMQIQPKLSKIGS